jgi:hypothetical protein
MFCMDDACKREIIWRRAGLKDEGEKRNWW